MNENFIIEQVAKKAAELARWVEKTAKKGELDGNLKMHYLSMLDGYSDLCTVLVEDVETFKGVLDIVWKARQEIERTENNNN